MSGRFLNRLLCRLLGHKPVYRTGPDNGLYCGSCGRKVGETQPSNGAGRGP